MGISPEPVLPDHMWHDIRHVRICRRVSIRIAKVMPHRIALRAGTLECAQGEGYVQQVCGKDICSRSNLTCLLAQVSPCSPGDKLFMPKRDTVNLCIDSPSPRVPSRPREERPG